MAKLVKCKDCGKEVSESAKTCPGCGSKIKKPIYKRVWFWVIIVFVVIGLSSGGNSETSENSKKNSNNSSEETKIEYIKVDIDELEKALENNAAAAKDTYDGKYVEVTGRLGTIDSDLQYISLLSTTDEWDMVGVHCSIVYSETKEVVKTLTKNQTIVVKGKITDVGEVLGYYLDIDEIITQ